MIARFCAYGFLKNLRLFEAFLLLALLERGLDFMAIGALISVREIAVNLLEIPSGALADGLGRKRCMVISMASYVVAYLILGLASDWWALAAAMVAYGVGDAFRSGTHKAMIYTWLRQQGRIEEKTQVYGHTRSWSKLGSACSALLGGAILLTGADYRWVFLGSAVPAALNLLNLATYPANLDIQPAAKTNGWSQSLGHLRQGLRTAFTEPWARRLVLSSAIVEGGYTVVKDYIQPLLQTLAVSLVLVPILDTRQRTSATIALVTAALFVLASAASRRAHTLEARFNNDSQRAATAIARGFFIAFIVLAVGLGLGQAWLAALAFIALGIGQNLWRPIHVGRFDRPEHEAQAATLLSVESQAKAAAAAIAAPILGALLDWTSAGASPIPLNALWPVALVGLPLILLVRTPK